MANRSSLFNRKTIVILSVFAVIVAADIAVIATHTSLSKIINHFKSTSSQTTTGKAVSVTPGAPPTCPVTDKLVNTCRPWLGVFAQGYPQVAAKFQDQTLYHEKRIGRQADFVKDSISPGELPSRQDSYFITRPNTYLYLTWKPALKWTDAAGGNATVDAQIDAMASTLKAQAPHKIMVSLFADPQEEVSGGGSTCAVGAYQGTNGTPANYRAMWTNVRNHFNALKVTNVVWTITYDDSKAYDCLNADMWPGNDLVDWVTFDSYANTDKDTFSKTVSQFYYWLSVNSDAAHNYAAKPWGLSEFSSHLNSQTNAALYWDDAKTALDANTFPNLKAYMVFDANSGKPDNRIDYWCDPLTVTVPVASATQTATPAKTTCPKPVQDDNEQNHYKAFATDPLLTDVHYKK